MSEDMWVAVIQGVCATAAAVLVGLVSRNQIRRRVGTPNGKGNLIEMAEQLIEGQDRMAEHLTALDDRTSTMVDSHAAMVSSQAAQDRRLAVLERDRPPWWVAWAPVGAAALLTVTVVRSSSRRRRGAPDR